MGIFVDGLKNELCALKCRKIDEKCDSILFYPITFEGRRGTTDEFATIPFQLILFENVIKQ